MEQNQTQRHLHIVLDSIAHLEGLHPGRYAEDKEIAKETGLEIQDVRDYIDILEDEAKVRTANSFDGYSAILTARGRLVLKDPQYILANRRAESGVNIFGNVDTGGGPFVGRDGLQQPSRTELPLSKEEKELLIAADKNEGQIALICTQQFDFVRIAGHNYINEEEPSSAAPYREALEDLVDRDYIRPGEGIVYKLTSSGRRQARSLKLEQ